MDDLKACPTCCCQTSKNAEFHRPGSPPRRCSARGKPTYNITFVATWSEKCQSSYYLDDAHWSPLTGVSHTASYEVWNGCMNNVSRGVALVSQTGRTDVIEGEYASQGDDVLDTLKGDAIFPGVGRTTRSLMVDAEHPYVTVLSMLAPSPDRMMGVSGLQLCSRDSWKRKVKVCGELFSTATASDRIGFPNSIQSNNCSFGYFLFEMQPPRRPRRPVRYREDCPPVESPPPADSCVCQPKGRSNL